MNTTVIPKFIVNLFKNEIQRIHKLLLLEIAKDYDLDYSELEKKYLCNVTVNNDNIQIIKKRNYNTNLSTDKQCQAYNAKQIRCQRSKGAHEQYCPIHLRGLPYGSIHNNQQTKVKPKKWEKLY